MFPPVQSLRRNDNRSNNLKSSIMFYSFLKRSCGGVTSAVDSTLNLSRTPSITSCETTDDERSTSTGSKNSSILSSIKNQCLNNKVPIVSSNVVSMKPPNTQPLASKLPPGISFQPKVPYPNWDYNWDSRNGSGSTTTSDKNDNSNRNTSNTSGGNVTRHIILVRHGQYEMESSDDKLRVLTPIGRQQAMLTGQRLASLTAAISKSSSVSMSTEANETPTTLSVGVAQPCTIKAIHVSSMTRAIETASIIGSVLQPEHVIVDLDDDGDDEHVVSSELSTTTTTTTTTTESIIRTQPDPLLSETIPTYVVPDRPDVKFKNTLERDEGFQQAEDAFQKYIHRAETTTSVTESTTAESSEEDKHEFEIIVCHANIIRYFICRALQIPPEAWLRMSLFNCSISYLMIQPNGYVTARLIGDSGHIPYELTTFSEMHGYNWHSMK